MNLGLTNYFHYSTLQPQNNREIIDIIKFFLTEDGEKIIKEGGTMEVIEKL
uniref:Uncharacterized protein n=1 Tax=Meloidogyne incognita TaxID=6306 RepID=A0A914NAT3_MELIC